MNKDLTLEQFNKEIESTEQKISELSFLDSKSVDKVEDLITKYNLPSYCIDIAFYLAQRNKHKRETIRDMCNRVGISTASFQYYRYSEGVIELSKIFSKRLIARYIPDVLNVVKDKALQGNIEASKLFLNVNEMTDDDSPKVVNNFNLVKVEELNNFVEDLRNKQI